MIANNEILKSKIFDFKVFPQPDGINSLCQGGNRKGLFLALAGEENPASVEFLEKILNAVNYDLHQDALTVFLTPLQNFSLTAVKSEKEVRQAIFFGVTPQQAGLNLSFAKYETLHFQGVTYMLADDLAMIEQYQNLKRQLWMALKGMFN